MMSELPQSIKADPQALAAPDEARQMLDVALSYEIDSTEMMQAAANELSAIVTRKKTINDKRMEMTRPLDQAKRAIMDFFAGPLELLDQAEKALKGGMLVYERNERERQAREQRAAEERARIEREEVERQARKVEEQVAAHMEAGDELSATLAAHKAEAIREQAELASFPAPVLVAPKTSGAVIRGTWKGRVTDKRALIVAAAQRPELQGLVEVNTTALNGMARAIKDSATIPGVEFYQDMSVAARGR